MRSSELFAPRPGVHQHAAILRREFAELLVTGKKTIEARLSRTRRAPLGCLAVGDLVHIKASGGEIVGTGWVRRFDEFAGLNPAAIERLRRRFNDEICASRRWWQKRRESRYAVLIWLEDVVPRFVATTVPPVPRQYGGGWVVLRACAGLRRKRVLRAAAMHSEIALAGASCSANR